MRKRLLRTDRLQADSFPDIKGEFDEVAARLARALKFDAGKLRGGHLLNALVLWFLDKPVEEQQAITVEGMKRFYALRAKYYAGDVPVDHPPKVIGPKKAKPNRGRQGT